MHIGNVWGSPAGVGAACTSASASEAPALFASPEGRRGYDFVVLFQIKPHGRSLLLKRQKVSLQPRTVGYRCYGPLRLKEPVSADHEELQFGHRQPQEHVTWKWSKLPLSTPLFSSTSMPLLWMEGACPCWVFNKQGLLNYYCLVFLLVERRLGNFLFQKKANAYIQRESKKKNAKKVKGSFHMSVWPPKR